MLKISKREQKSVRKENKIIFYTFLVKRGKDRINADVLSLSNEIQEDLNELLLAKE
jgi:hypothetical protein